MDYTALSHILQFPFMNFLVRDKTVLIITHRLPAIIHAEQILVMDNGHLAESGRHDELLARNGRYAALWRAGRREADAEYGGA